jgi:hypothetical protein
MKTTYALKTGEKVLEIDLPDDWTVVDPRSAWAEDAPNRDKDFLCALQGFDSRCNLKAAIDNLEHTSMYIEMMPVPPGEDCHKFIQEKMHRRNPYLKEFEPDELLRVDGRDAELHTWSDGLNRIAGIFIPFENSHVVLFEFAPPLEASKLDKAITTVAKEMLAKVVFA